MGSDYCTLLMCLLPLLLTLSCIRAHIINCDFENEADPMCGFYNVDTDDANFKRSAGAQHPGGNDSSPTFDHTYSNSTGHFLDTDVLSSGMQSTRVAKVYSPTVAIPAGMSKICLEFSYHMFGRAVDSLRVYKTIGVRQTPIFNATGSLGDSWTSAVIDVVIQSGSSSIQFVFVASITRGMSGDIALDDIKVSLAECGTVVALEATTNPPPTTTPMPPLFSYDCTFDDPGDVRCTPKTNPANDFDWMFRQAGIRPNNQAPVYDHTTSTSAGMYLYVPQDGSQASDEETGEFRTALLQATFQSKCLQFYYYMRGSQVGTLNAYTNHNNNPPPAIMPWNRTGDQGGYWTRGLLNINPTFATYQIVFEAKRLRDYGGCIAVDDLKLMDGRCPSEEVKCDFESLHACFFTQDRTTDDMDWAVGNGATPSYGTGPSNDHTYGNSTGFYMYIETSSPVAVGHVARLVSPPITETHGHAHCLIFWYHMHGQHVDALNVLMANASAPTQSKLIWSLAGNRGNKWRAAEVHVTNHQDFVIIFEAIRGSSYLGDIAIDDVWITSTEGCPGEAGLKNFSSITCDFEEIEICYWAQDTADDFDWTWQNAADQDLVNTGPDEDHTTGSQLGFYMFIQEDYVTVPGGTARLVSPEAKAQPVKSCLEFYYHMYGRDIESLNVYMKKTGDAGLLDNPIWSMSGDKGNYWHRATVDIPITDFAFQFVMEGTRGQAYRDNIAIDDIKFYEGQNCPTVTTDAPIPTTTPTPVTSANCAFEDVNNTLCGYTQSIYDELDWSVGSRDPTQTDNMPATAKGSFLYLDTRSYYLRSGDRAELYSPLVTQSDQPQCLEFSYYLSGYNADFLLVHLTQWGASLAIDPHFSVYGDQGDQWNMARVNIPPMESNFQVVFTAMFSYYSLVGIDEIKFTMGACPIETTTPSPADGHCDFEQGLAACGYEHARYDFYWLKHSGKTGSEGTGPSVDHTTGTENGQFMYIEASLPQRPDQRARMLTPFLYHNRGTPLCMLFYYHMNGADVGEINIYSQSKTGTKTLLTLTGNARDMWQPAAVDLSYSGSRFQVVFEGVVGYGVAGDMAIDDVSVRREPCPGFAKSAATNFETPGDLNGFSQFSMGDTHWLWYDQYNDAQSTLPDELRAGDGSFMFIDGTQFKPETSASILSPVMAGHATEHCLDYDYAIYEDGGLRLSIGQKDGLSYDLMSKIETTAWQHDRRTLSKAEVGEDFLILFTGIVGSTGSGYVAVDNLVIREKSCNELSEPGEPAGQASSGGSVAAAVLVAVLLIVVAAVTAVGGFCYIRRRQEAKTVPPVLYSNKGNGDANDNNAGQLSSDLSIANPNYDNSPLHSSA